MNKLETETSPYLRQHANNPVDWYPWNAESLEKARVENKPILLSIGYAACHWCHVMAHESFEDEETATIMNRYFVNIKVDREERPDLDKIYQTAHQLLTRQSGGWPLTVFLTPDDLTPFFTGTYFPKVAKYHLPSFKEVLMAIVELFQKQKPEIKAQNEKLISILKSKPPQEHEADLNEIPIQKAIAILESRIDPVHGGFDGAPKFPQVTRWQFLLIHRSPTVIQTLFKMAQGGIRDVLDGGFYRYTVDDRWEIPHFEKMLYDNAQLLMLYTMAYQRYQQDEFDSIVHENAQWVMQMQSDEGGFYSSLDADSEGEEGKFYVWDRSEIKTLLDAPEYEFVRIHYGLDKPPNFENKFWHLQALVPLDEAARQLKLSEEEANQLLKSAKEKLYTTRKKRIPPALDDKILTSWNALMIKALFLAADVFQNQEWQSKAFTALRFIQSHLYINNRLLASYHAGRANLPAYLDDYVFLCDAVITSLQLQWDSKNLTFAVDLIETILKFFADHEEGGFYFTASDHETLLYRPKVWMDDVIPSGNGVLLSLLILLGHLLEEARYFDKAEQSLRAVWSSIQKYPAEHLSMLLGLEQYLTAPSIIIIRGESRKIEKWRKAVKKIDNFVFAIPDTAANLPASLSMKKATANACAYVCKGTQCLAVIEDLDELLKVV